MFVGPGTKRWCFPGGVYENSGHRYSEAAAADEDEEAAAAAAADEEEDAEDAEEEDAEDDAKVRVESAAMDGK